MFIGTCVRAWLEMIGLEAKRSDSNLRLLLLLFTNSYISSDGGRDPVARIAKGTSRAGLRGRKMSLN